MLFTEEYAYFSSYSSSWLQHAQRYVRSMVERFQLTADSRVVEVAANDGYLLQYVRAAGIPCYGIEPTASTAAAAKGKGIEIVEKFFGMDLADELAKAGRQADLIVANNVLAHVPDINDFTAGFARLLKADGVATFEFPHLLRMVRENQFDTAYHEHYSYLSLIAAEAVLNRNGLSVFDVETLPTHGGSLRVFAQRLDASRKRECSKALIDLRQAETVAGMNTKGFYDGFQAIAENAKNELIAYLLDAKRQRLKVAAYGAAAKGNTLLNFAGVRPDLLPYVADRNPAKQGKFLPGSRIPIFDEEHLIGNRPDRILILPWNLADEVMAQLSYVKEWHGQFVTAVPKLTVSRGLHG